MRSGQRAEEKGPIDWNAEGHAEKYQQNSSPQFERNMSALDAFFTAFSLDHYNQEGVDVLDVGCGTGETDVAMAKKLPRANVLAIDLASEKIKTAQASHSSISNLTFAEGDAAIFKFYKQFDLITSFFCLQWVPVELLPVALGNIYQHLKQDQGRMCVLIPCYDFTHKILKGLPIPQNGRHFQDFREQQSYLSKKSMLYRIFIRSTNWISQKYIVIASHKSDLLTSILRLSNQRILKRTMSLSNTRDYGVVASYLK